MIPFGYLGSVCTRLGCPGDPGEETGYAETLPAGRIANRYSVVDGKLVVRPLVDVEAEEQAQTDAIAALAARVAAIETAQNNAGLKEYTVQQGTDWITNKLTNAPATIPGVKQAVGEILIKMLPYLLLK